MESSNSRRGFIKKVALALPVLTGNAIFSESKSPAVRRSSKLKLSLNVYSFNSLLRAGKIDLFDVLKFCEKYDLDAIDPTGYYFPGYPDSPPDEFVNRFKREAFLSGIDISGTGVRNDFANPDPESRRKDIEVIKKWIETAALLGSPNLRIFSGANDHDGFSRDQVFDWMAEDIRECCDYGKKFGVVIALQNHNDFLKTSADVDRLFEMVNSEWLGLNLDIGSYRMSDPYSEIGKNIRHAVTWQIKENVWINGKETPVDLRLLLTIIKNAGYRGYLPVETLGAGDPFEKVPKLLEDIRKALLNI
ncbi:MAG: sugar phosphate isomerase/epimerase [Bacteroidales bacterium]|jgi:sugar phosphate isomerase/epimerase|nr:sugar phosphate isomerase/epimerase [Bacteroidales bacterium]